MRYYLLILPLLGIAGGCIVTQPQDTPVPALQILEQKTQTSYWIYVPSGYTEDRDWPLVVTLHGSSTWDSSKTQIDEWKYLAEQKGLIVVAPDLSSVSGYRLNRDKWMENLKRDEQAVLAVMDEVTTKYRISMGRGGERPAILLTGFLQGGYPLYYIGLLNPKWFSMLIARDCYTDEEMLNELELSEDATKLSILIFNGKDGWSPLPTHGWDAYRCLRQKRCYQTRRKEVRGGQLRRPELAYQNWSKHLPPRLRK